MYLPFMVLVLVFSWPFKDQRQVFVLWVCLVLVYVFRGLIALFWFQFLFGLLCFRMCSGFLKSVSITVLKDICPPFRVVTNMKGMLPFRNQKSLHKYGLILVSRPGSGYGLPFTPLWSLWHTWLRFVIITRYINQIEIVIL